MSSEERMEISTRNAIFFVNEKYGIEFIPDSYVISDYLSSTDYIQCYAEGMDSENEHVEVYISEEDNGITYSDNYFSYLVRPQAEEYVSEIIKSEFTDFKVFRDNEYVALSNDLTSNSTLEDLYRIESHYRMRVNIYILHIPGTSKAIYEEQVHRIEELLIKTNRRLTVSLYVLGDNTFESIGRYSQNDFYKFYAEHDVPDNQIYFFVYNGRFTDGNVKYFS